jgi:SAM-dependent methyltransferase
MDSIPLISPNTGGVLRLENEKYVNTLTGESFRLEGNVVRFLWEDDDFYEGAYLNKIKYIPFSEKWPFIFPIWLIGCGYLWEVRKQFKPGASLVELGCAGGVDYFGRRYNMIGLDLSFKSLSKLTNYRIGLQANATAIPLPDASVDGVISSFFWEHISIDEKKIMLTEFSRVLKPNGKLVFLYDVETENSVVRILKEADPLKYQMLFKDQDGHFGYENPSEASRIFSENGFKVSKHFGMERTWLQSSSVYQKMSQFDGNIGLIGRLLSRIFSNRVSILFNILVVRLLDETIGKLLSIDKSRIILTIAKKSKT